MFGLIFITAFWLYIEGDKCYDAGKDVKTCASDVWEGREATYKVNR